MKDGAYCRVGCIKSPAHCLNDKMTCPPTVQSVYLALRTSDATLISPFIAPSHSVGIFVLATALRFVPIILVYMICAVVVRPPSA